jgi:hypothetical protein
MRRRSESAASPSRLLPPRDPKRRGHGQRRESDGAEKPSNANEANADRPAIDAVGQNGGVKRKIGKSSENNPRCRAVAKHQSPQIAFTARASRTAMRSRRCPSHTRGPAEAGHHVKPGGSRTPCLAQDCGGLGTGTVRRVRLRATAMKTDRGVLPDCPIAQSPDSPRERVSVPCARGPGRRCASTSARCPRTGPPPSRSSSSSAVAGSR